MGVEVVVGVTVGVTVTVGEAVEVGVGGKESSLATKTSLFSI